MKKTIFIILSVFLLTGCVSSNQQINTVDEKTKIRIGWQIPWATQGQLTQVLKNKNFLQENNFDPDFKGFSYGGPLNEAALASEIDVLFTADQPAVTLISKNPNWTIIGRLMYNRVSLYVPPKSDINEIKDLAGKTVAMPFGAAAQRVALKVEEEAGLDPEKDVNNINLGIYEQSDLVRDPESKSWGDINAMTGFDPTPAIFEEKGLVKNLHVGKVVSVIVMSNDYIKNNPDAPAKFLQSFFDAYDYYRLNVEQANNWFKEEAGLDITPEALGIASSIEPNVNATNRQNIYIDFKDEDYVIMQEAADFLYEQEMIENQINVKDYIDLNYLLNIK